MPYQLGIDTGGTYTDAVIIDAPADGAGHRHGDGASHRQSDETQTVIAKRKSLTTRYDLTVGINNALSGLPRALLDEVALVALSTTLSTNSVVEGRGAPVAILLPGYSTAQVEKSGLLEILDRELITILDGGHDAVGAPLMALDTARAADAIRAQHEKVSAFAVSGLFATRNPEHECALRDLATELTGKPVACGHELATALGAPRRALTTALNARMILYIQTLIGAVESILQQKNIGAPLMIVKGDGSLVNSDTARRQPVATVLSGPAASVIGACALSGRRDAIIVDMGGTTTDIAVVADGRPELCEDGARIGDWQPFVEAVRVFSIGLGGDSEVSFKGKLALSHRRVVPLSLLAHQFPEVLPRLERQWSASPSPRNNRFALRLQKNEVLLRQLNDTERAAWDALSDAPIELESLVDTDRARLRALARMERMGLVIYSGFTPTDATHVLGMSSHWDATAATRGAQIWARQMRHLYGCGKWKVGDARAPCREVFALVTRDIATKLIEAGLNQRGVLTDSKSRNLTKLLTEMVLNVGDAKKVEPLFQLKFADNLPLVAVGAPARDYFPEVAEMLAMELVLPPNADTANAVGAALGAVVQTAHVTVTQPESGVFYLFHNKQPMRFEQLDVALAKANEIATAEAAAMAAAAGAVGTNIQVRRRDNHVKHDIDGELFVSAVVTAVATGRPNCAVQPRGVIVKSPHARA